MACWNMQFRSHVNQPLAKVDGQVVEKPHDPIQPQAEAHWEPACYSEATPEVHMENVAVLVAELQGASTERKQAIFSELERLCRSDNSDEARSAVEKSARSQILTIQWELEEILERTAPPPVEPPPAPEEESKEEAGAEEPAEDGAINPSDVEMVYEDPRGLILHRTKTGDRWLATQMDPRTGQPQTFELHPQEIEQLKVQLAHSPYWVLGKKPE